MLLSIGKLYTDWYAIKDSTHHPKEYINELKDRIDTITQMYLSEPSDNFGFKSKFSQTIHEIFIDSNLNMVDIANELSWEVVKVSEYYNDRRLLNQSDATKLCLLLSELGYEYSPQELIDMQKVGMFIDYNTPFLTIHDLIPFP